MSLLARHVVHLKQESLSVEELKVLPLKMPEQRLDIPVSTVEENLAVAQTPHRPLWVSVDTKYRSAVILHKARSFEECAITAERHHKVDVIRNVSLGKLVAPLDFHVSAGLLESIDHLVGHSHVHVSGFLPDDVSRAYTYHV